MKYLKDRRVVVRIVSYMLALILVLGGLAWVNGAEKENYRWQLEASYQHYFSELAEGMRGVSTALRKGQYSGSRVLMSSLASEISREAAAAKSAMSGLPFSNIELEKTAKFLSQIGDYSYFLAKKDASGLAITNEELENMAELSATAYSLSMSLDELYESVADGSMSVSYALDSEQDAEARVSGIAAALSEIETQFPEYAGLIYDGPFSEHISSREASFLVDKSDVSVEQARAVAASAGGFEPSELNASGETAGNLPTYGFYAERDGVTWFFDVTKRGGVLLEMYCSRTSGEPSLEPQQCVDKAKSWLGGSGFGSLVESYYYEEDGVVTINFAASSDGVICYPDLIKVSVAADNGEIIGFESRGYIMNHHDRTIEEPAITVDEAREMLRDGLTIESERPAVIPTAGEYEVLCYEFLCSGATGERALIYLNAATGVEEQILILVESEYGTLTI